MSRVFLTGASGYIGGQVLHSLATSHPELTIRALVREDAKARAITTAFPNVQIVEGSLDDVSILERETAEADIILHLAATGHLTSVETIHETLKKRPADRGPAHWIQVSGATVLAAAELADDSWVPGSPSDVIFDDLDGASHLVSFIKQHPSRAVDNYVLSVAANTPRVNTALVPPGIIFGVGEGPCNQRSFQIPELSKITLQRRRGLQVGKGQSRWGTVHIRDLGDLFVRLVERALEGGPGQEDLWNLNGIYLTGIGETTFGDMSKGVASAAAAKGWIPVADVEETNGDELFHGAALYGSNARCRSRRGIERLGWSPQRSASLEVEYPRVVEEEAKALGIA